MAVPDIGNLNEAEARRAKSHHIRKLCRDLSDRQAIDALTAYADELDLQAVQLQADAPISEI